MQNLASRLHTKLKQAFTRMRCCCSAGWSPRLARNARHLTAFARNSSTPFDVICLPDHIDPRKLTTEDLYLDEQNIARHYRDVERPLGVIGFHSGSRFGRGVAKRLALRLGRRAAEKCGLPARAISKAWYFAIWCEICVLVPARHLAKHIAKLAGDELIIVPIDKLTFQYLSYWAPNDLEPLYLAFALRRCGARVLLAFTGQENAQQIRVEGPHALKFRPHAAWPSSDLEGVLTAGLGAVLVPLGLRRFAPIVSEYPHILSVGADHAPLGHDRHANLWATTARPPCFSLALRSEAQVGVSTQILSLTADVHSLEGWLLEALCETTRTAGAAARRIAERYDLREAHICDHLFFESAIVAEAVVARGGATTLWPHSSNAVHVEMHNRDEITQVRCVTMAGAARWEARLPDADRIIQSSYLLQPCATRRPFTVGSPLTIIVFGGAHALQRMPILDIKGHQRSYYRLFRAMTQMWNSAQMLFKPKDPWESAGWLREALGEEVDFEETNTSPLSLDFPNMIFLTVSFGSTALLEGLGRGIPCMIVREFPVEDYTHFDEKHVPIGHVETIMDMIARCVDPAFYEALICRELEWYKSETRFDSQQSQ